VAAGLAVPTVDVGIASLAMHSARELCGAADSALLIGALRAFLTPA
jgi:aspartyl aminopeptidase